MAAPAAVCGGTHIQGRRTRSASVLHVLACCHHCPMKTPPPLSPPPAMALAAPHLPLAGGAAADGLAHAVAGGMASRLGTLRQGGFLPGNTRGGRHATLFCHCRWRVGIQLWCGCRAMRPAAAWRGRVHPHTCGASGREPAALWLLPGSPGTLGALGTAANAQVALGRTWRAGSPSKVRQRRGTLVWRTLPGSTSVSATAAYCCTHRRDAE